MSGNLVEETIKLLHSDKCVRQTFFIANAKSDESICNSEIDVDGTRLSDVAAFVNDIKNNKPFKTRLLGDFQLWKSSQDAQRLILLLLEVRSLLDVLESSQLNSTGVRKEVALKDSFSMNSWKWEFDEMPADQPFETDILNLRVPPSTINATIGTVMYAVPQREKESSKPNYQQDTVSYRELDQIWGVNFGIDTMTFGDSQIRKVMGIETLLTGKFDYQRYSENYAILAGVQPYFGQGKDGFALTSRLAWVHPEIEAALSASFRMLYLPREGMAARWKPSGGLRLDLGFSSFLTSYLQGARDSAVQRDGSVRTGWSIGAGLQFGAPTCRIPGVNKMNSCF